MLDRVFAFFATGGSLIDSNTFIVGNVDATKRLGFQVDNQTTATTLTLNTGAQTVDRQLNVPVLSATDTLMVLGLAQTMTGVLTLGTPLAAGSGGTGISNAGTLTNASNTTITGGGTLALAGFALTVPATGTAALREAANTFTLANTFSVAGNGAVAISSTANSTAPGTGALICQGSLVSNAAGNGVAHYNVTANNFSGGLSVYKRGATGDSTASVVSGAEIGYNSFYAWDGASYGRASFIISSATEAWSGSAHGGKIDIYTTPNGSTSNGIAITIGQDKSLSVFGTTTSTTLTSNSLYAAGGIGIADAKNINVGSSTGCIIGTATTQKLGFWNATPIVQPASANQAAVATTAATNVAPYGFTTAAQADGIITLLNEIRLSLVNAGIIKGAA